jgi:hypothetical protein
MFYIYTYLGTYVGNAIKGNKVGGAPIRPNPRTLSRYEVTSLTPLGLHDTFSCLVLFFLFSSLLGHNSSSSITSNIHIDTK